MPTKKHLGQHWLKDPEVLAHIADAAEILPDDTVLEIGPGLGTLTSRLLVRAGSVVAVEFDADLARKLPGQFPGKNLQVIHEDILQFNPSTLPVGYKVVANVPYYITSKIIQHLTESQNPPSIMVLLVQKEVAERMAAEPGSKAYGALSVAVQYYTKPYILMTVPPRSFIPAPAVESAVICCERREKPAVEVEDEALFFRVVKAAFGQRRKTLANALKAGGFPQEQLQLVLAKAGIDAMRRGETLSLDEFAAIANGLFAQKRTEEKL